MGAPKLPAVDWAVAAAAGVAGETAERGLRLLGVKSGDTIFVDGGAGGVGAVAVQMAVARGARVIASASEANQDYLREIGSIPVLYGEGVAGRVRDAAGGHLDAVFDVAGKTPIEELVSLVSEPSQVVTIANFAAGQAGARVTGGDADSRPAEALAEVAETARTEQARDQDSDLPVRARCGGVPDQPSRSRPRKARSITGSGPGGMPWSTPLLSDHFGCLPARTPPARLPDGAGPGPGIRRMPSSWCSGTRT